MTRIQVILYALFPRMDRLSVIFGEARKREGNAPPPTGNPPRGYHPGLWPVLRKGWKEPVDGVGGRHLPREKEDRAEGAG